MRYPKRKQVVQAAIRRVDAMDRHDKKAGHATPEDLGALHSAQTALFALDCALSMFERGKSKEAIECVGDAVVMLARGINRTDVLERATC